jgi:fatty acid desaturase
MVANAIVMAHIITNHSLSPLSHKNDALETSLTVSVPRWFEFYSLGFGYHVEHHLFPAMSNRHGPLVQRELRRRAPRRYQEMKLSRALRLMFKTPRVYGEKELLVDPETGETARTLGPPSAVAAPTSVGTGRRKGRIGARPQIRSREGEKEGVDAPRMSSIPPPPTAA